MCEAGCGLLAEVAQDEVTALRPDPAHPVSHGYACKKGTTFHARVAAHPQRILRPRLRGEQGWRDVSWHEALAAVGTQLRAVIDRYGPGSVGLYTGNAAGQAFGAVLGAAALQRGLGTVRHYSCLTLDNSMMFVVAERVFGHPLATFVADYEGSDAILLFGTDPLSSQASQAQSHPTAVPTLRARREVLMVVDPRRSDTARAASLHLAPQVGSDVFVLAWLVACFTDDPDLRAATLPFSLARVSRVSGLSESALQAMEARLRRAQRPLVWSGLGVLLGPHGTLGYWLTVALQAALGGLDRPGGWRWQPGAVDLLRWASWLGIDRYGHSRAPVGGWPSILGTIPAATLPADEGLRALVVIGGDPARALPDAAAARRRLAALDCLVCIDILPSPTTELAHAVLPATTWLERDESALHLANQRSVRHLRVDRRVVRPRGEAREELSIALDLCGAAGVVPFGSRVAGAAARGLGVAGITRLLMALPLRPSPVPVPRLGVPEWCEALRSLSDPAPGLRLVTSVRPLSTMNHWLRTESVSVRAHPADVPSGRAIIRGPAGTLSVVIEADEHIARGAIVFPFGDPDLHPNVLVSSADLEAFTGQPISNGTRVEVVPLDAPPADPIADG